MSARFQKGYTLLEMAVVMLIISIFVVAAIPLLDLYYKEKQHEQILTKQKIIDAALHQYRELRGRYPCPARGNLPPTDPQYGREVFNCATMSMTAGNCNNGLCFEASERTVTVDGASVRPMVIRGTVPYKDLNIAEGDSYDSYGGRFSYAVTDLLTDKDSYRVNRGGIEIVDGQQPPVSVLSPEASAHYFVFSHGEDGIGAYNRAGAIGVQCDGPMHDNENCNTSPDHANARYRYTLFSTETVVLGSSVTDPDAEAGQENRHYDDYASYIGIGQQPTWEQAEEPNTKELRDTINLHSNVEGKVVVAGEDVELSDDDRDDEDLKLYVEGAARVHPENVAKVDTGLCDSTGADPGCIEPVLVGADDPADPRRLHCAPSQEIVIGRGLAQKRLDCGPPDITCSDRSEPGGGRFMVGVDADGRPICASPVSCASRDVTLCGLTQTLPAARPNSVATVTAGASYSEIYRCNGNVWELQSSSGVCTCTPGSTTTTSACPTGMQGSITRVTTRVCPSGQQTTRETANTCRCVPSDTTYNQNCPQGHTGTIVMRRVVTCNGNTPNVSTQTVSNTCVCTPQTQTRQVNCETGHTGRINQERRSVCPGGQYPNTWTETSRNCVCNQPSSETVSCPSGFNAGRATRTCNTNCGRSPAVTTCSVDTSNCSCVPSDVVTRESCGVGYDGEVTVTTRETCPGANRTVTRDRSACRPRSITCTVSADGGQTGTGRTTWAHGDRCTSLATEDTCTGIRYCYRTVGPNDYRIYNCSCK